MNRWEKIMLAFALCLIIVLQSITLYRLKPNETPTPAQASHSVTSIFGSSRPPGTNATPAPPMPTVTPPVNLPEPESKGASLVRQYCKTCHAPPSPQQHTAAEWEPLLAKKKTSMSGARVTNGFFGGGGISVPMPSDSEWRELKKYLQTNAK